MWEMTQDIALGFTKIKSDCISRVTFDWHQSMKMTQAQAKQLSIPSLSLYQCNQAKIKLSSNWVVQS